MILYTDERRRPKDAVCRIGEFEVKCDAAKLRDLNIFVPKEVRIHYKESETFILIENKEKNEIHVEAAIPNIPYINFNACFPAVIEQIRPDRLIVGVYLRPIGVMELKFPNEGKSQGFHRSISKFMEFFHGIPAFLGMLF